MSYTIMCMTGGDGMKESESMVEGLVLELRRGLLILGVLSQLDQKEYGYSLIQKLQEKNFIIESGTLYPLLRKNEKQELLDSTWDLVENRPRRYYQISEKGKEVFEKLKQEYILLNDTMIDLLKGEDSWKK